jgi:hypothetical protein
MRRARALLLLSIAVLLVAATCGSDGYDDGPLDSGIEGTVTIGPICPVVTEESPCPDQPFQAEIFVLDEEFNVVLSFKSGRDGTFRVDLAPGAYRVVPLAPNGDLPPIAPEQDVVVRAGGYTHVAIQYDSGIR